MGSNHKYRSLTSIGDKFNLLLYVAVVLDPRNKKRFLKFSFMSIYGEDVADIMMVKVEDALTKLFNYYKNVYDSLNVEVRIEDEEMPTVVDDDDLYAVIASQFNTYLEGGFFNSSMSELDKYLTDVVEKVPKGEEGKFDLLNWWKVNSSKY